MKNQYSGRDPNFPECVTYSIYGASVPYIMFYCGTTESEGTASFTLQSISTAVSSYQNPLPTTPSTSSSLGHESTISFGPASPSTSSPLLPSFSHHSLLSFSPLARFGRRSIAVPLYVPPQLQQSPLPVGHIFCLSFFSSPQSPVRKLRLCFRLTILPLVCLGAADGGDNGGGGVLRVLAASF